MILIDPTPQAMKRGIKDNLYEFFRYLRRSGLTEFKDGEGWIRWHTPIPHPWFNGVLCLKAVDGIDSVIQDQLAYFKAKGTPLFTWWLGNDLEAQTWERLLLSHGFRYDANTPGMAVDIVSDLNNVSLPLGLRIVPVEDREALREWVHILVMGYPLPNEWENDLFRLMEELGLNLPLRNYLGYLDGAPVATSSLFLAAGVAGVQFVATLPEARGRGIGAALTLAPLLDARQLGYRVGILQSSEMGYRVYERLGFQRLTTIDHFYKTLPED